MAYELSLVTGEQLEFRDGFPATYRGTSIHGADSFYCKTNLLELLLQEITEDFYSIRLTEGKALQQLTTNGKIDSTGIYSYFMLKNGIRKNINSVGRFHLREDQYSCLFLQPTQISSSFEKNKPFKMLDIFYSPFLLNELVPYFPDLRNIILSEKSAAIPENKCWALPSMNEILNHLIHCPFDTETRTFYFDLKVREVLYQMLEFGFKGRNKLLRFTPWEVARVHEARELLKGYVTQKPPTLKQLSRMVALNEFKLKRGFRQFYHCGIFKWLQGEKMKYAQDVILNTDKQIKDICTMVGYPRSSNFINAFRTHFGMTPASLRRK